MDQNPVRTIFERFTFFMEHDTIGVKVFAYGISGIGLLTALYKIRPFAKFKQPSDIPSHFIKTQVPLRGTVIQIEPSSEALLMIDHKPLLPFPRLTTTKYLPVRLAGIRVTGHGISWLQSVVKGKEVVFTPLTKQREYAECIVTMPQENQEEHLTIAEELVKLGFGTVAELQSSSEKNKSVVKYQRALTNAQKLAERRRNGNWQFIKPPTYSWKVQTFIREKLRPILPVFLVKQMNF